MQRPCARTAPPRVGARENAQVGKAVRTREHATVRRLEDALTHLGKDPRRRIGHEGLARYGAQVSPRVERLELAVLVEPAIGVLHEERGAAGGLLGRLAADAPDVVKPDVKAKGAQVKDIVKVFSARDVGVKRHAGKGLRVKRAAASAHVV